jgi:hypothetical protein
MSWPSFFAAADDEIWWWNWGLKMTLQMRSADPARVGNCLPVFDFQVFALTVGPGRTDAGEKTKDLAHSPLNVRGLLVRRQTLL